MVALENQEFTDYHILSSQLVLGGGQITDFQSMEYTKINCPKSTVLNGVVLKQLLFIYLHMPCSLSSPWPNIIVTQKGTKRLCGQS